MARERTPIQHIPAYSNKVVILIPFCHKDWTLAAKMLRWMGKLGKVPTLGVLHWDEQTPQAAAAEVNEAAAGVFTEGVTHSQYHGTTITTWPQAPNHCFQNAVEFVRTRLNRPFLFLEPDAFPTRPKWFENIQAEYDVAWNNSKPFMGHWVDDIIPGGHMTGVGVYPPNVGRHVSEAMLAMNTPWDIAMAQKVRNWFYRANHLFQHRFDPPPGPTFKSWYDVADGPYRVDFRAAIFHRCKDGSAIDRMIERENSTEVNVPDFIGGIRRVDVPQSDVRGSCRIMIVTYRKDFPWLIEALKSIDKYARGFSGVRLVIPRADIPKLPFVTMRNVDLSFHPYDELPGKGMVQHMAMIGNADSICPTDDFIMHSDADVIFYAPITPSEYIIGDKPVYVVRTYESLIDRTGTSKITVSNRRVTDLSYQWKAVAEANIGMQITMYGMCRHPTCFPRRFYLMFRNQVEKTHSMTFDDYVLAQRNEFPQTFAEFPAMGGFAFERCREMFHWMDVEVDGAPHEKMKNFWSHGGLHQKMDDGRTAQEWIDEMLARDNWPQESVKPKTGKHKRARVVPPGHRTGPRDWKTFTSAEGKDHKRRMVP